MPSVADPDPGFLACYDDALPHVYGYLLRRCGEPAVAEDLTSETFLAAVDALRRGAVSDPTVAWLVTVARNKLVDHWRRAERDQRLGERLDPPPDDDPWDATLDAAAAHEVLGALGGHHRAALTLRYLDGLPVPEVAQALGRTTGATEVLLVRARRAFRTAYDDRYGDERHGEEAR